MTSDSSDKREYIQTRYTMEPSVLRRLYNGAHLNIIAYMKMDLQST